MQISDKLDTQQKTPQHIILHEKNSCNLLGTNTCVLMEKLKLDVEYFLQRSDRSISIPDSSPICFNYYFLPFDLLPLLQYQGKALIILAFGLVGVVGRLCLLVIDTLEVVAELLDVYNKFL